MPKKKPRAKATAMISPVASSTVEAVARPVTHKRVSRLRANWFIVGSVFGVAISFFMNFLVTVLVMPEYRALTGRMHGEMTFAGESHQKITEVTQAAPQTPIDLMAAVTAAPADVAPVAVLAEAAYPRNLTLKVGDGDTLVGMLLENHVPSNEAHNVVAALKAQFNPKSLKVGQKISLTLSRHETLDHAAAVKELAIKLPNLNTVELARADDGNFNVESVKAELKDKAYHGYGTVKTSLFQAGADGGIPNGAMAEIVQAFSYDVDFQRDIHPGDTIEALLDRKENSEGKVGGYGNVRYAALTLNHKKHEIYSFKDSYGQFAWYDGKGNSVKKSLLRTPLNAARITSGFGMRVHPLLGYSKMHKGVDFGATTGTPIMAAGDGVVEFKGWKTGYGNFVLLRHNNTYETAYGHMSRFATINIGSRIKQGQVIGFVGMTGAATGPHLHYEVRQNEVQVNPAARQFNLASGLTGKQLAAFTANKAALAKEMASVKAPALAAVASR